jgi:hypothetical protein
MEEKKKLGLLEKEILTFLLLKLEYDYVFKGDIKMKIKIKCPDCRTGYYSYCSTNPPIYVCSNYGGGCCKGISKEKYEELAKQIMPKMSLYEIQQVIFDIIKVKQSCL